jgi:CBS domain containing-hemolysin-like protein
MVMDAYGVIIVCGLGALLLRALEHAYFYLPQKEFKRRASQGNPLLRKLVRINEFGVSVRLFLGLAAYILLGIAIIRTGQRLSLLSALSVLALLAVLFRAAGSKNSRTILRLAAFIAPYFEMLLRYINPPVQAVSGIITKRRKNSIRTEIYEKDDLKALLRRQQKAVNNRIEPAELHAALRALELGTKKIRDYMVPHEEIEFVNAKEPIGPILLSELHRSGHRCFPVQGNSKHEVIGMLYLDDVIQHTEGGVVSSVMDPQPRYVRDDQNLEQVFDAFNKTNRGIFIVVDVREKVVGLITLLDVLEQVTGHSIESEFEDFHDPSAVAHS